MEFGPERDAALRSVHQQLIDRVAGVPVMEVTPQVVAGPKVGEMPTLAGIEGGGERKVLFLSTDAPDSRGAAVNLLAKHAPGIPAFYLRMEGKGLEPLVDLVRLPIPTTLVLDADGLNAFSTQPGLLKILAAREAPTVLTPHPGEAARLLGVSSSDINRDRIGAARKLCEATGSVVLLKGACSVIAAPDGRIAINPNGGPNLSSGGTGDVLAGMVGALLGQGLDAWNAATLAAWIHGATADRLSQQTGPSGMLASELADALPACCEGIRRGSDPDQPEAPQREREFSFLLPFPGA